MAAGEGARARSLPGDWSGLVVFCAATSWDGNQFPDQHIARRLTRYAPVLYVDPPISHLSPRRNPDLAASLERPRLRVLAPNLARLTPVVPPGKAKPVIAPVAWWLTKRAIGHAVRSLTDDVHAVVAASFAPVFGICGERLRVFYGTDDFVAGAELFGVGVERLRRDEARQLADADVVIAISTDLADRYRRLGHVASVVPNGCDDALFATTPDTLPASDIDLPEPIVGYIGHMAARIDLRLLEAIVERGRSLLLVGPDALSLDRARFDRLVSAPNVQWVGRRPFNSLPSYLRAMAVGILPYGDTEFNRASFPLKLLEYLAGGRAAVATDLPAVRSLATDLVEVASEPSAFADAVDRAIAGDNSEAMVRRRMAFAGGHTWDERAESFASLMGLGARAGEPT